MTAELIGLVSPKMRLNGGRRHEYERKTWVTVTNCNQVDTSSSANSLAAEHACHLQNGWAWPLRSFTKHSHPWVLGLSLSGMICEH